MLAPATNLNDNKRTLQPRSTTTCFSNSRDGSRFTTGVFPGYVISLSLVDIQALYDGQNAVQWDGVRRATSSIDTSPFSGILDMDFSRTPDGVLSRRFVHLECAGPPITTTTATVVLPRPHLRSLYSKTPKRDSCSRSLSSRQPPLLTWCLSSSATFPTSPQSGRGA